MSENPQEQRRHPRHEIPLQGTLKSGGCSVPCQVINISAGGALIEADANLRIDDWATIRIPDFGSMTGRVVRITSTNIGLSFTDGEAAVDAFILEWLALNGGIWKASRNKVLGRKDDQSV